MFKWLKINRFWVSRKVYDEQIDNLKRLNKGINEDRKKLDSKCRQLQAENIEMKIIKDNKKTYLLKRCQNCKKYFTVEKGSKRKYCLDCKKSKKKASK